MNITFTKATFAHKDAIFSWLKEPHMIEFWDNSQEHKDDIVNFINGRKEPSNYFDGIFTYWIGSIVNKPYSLIMTSQEIESDNPLWQENLSKAGHTITIDFAIGSPVYLGKGLASPTLEAFVKFYHEKIDSKADTFFIDPDINNPRAFHVYEKAGFKLVDEFAMEDGFFEGNKNYLMVKKIK